MNHTINLGEALPAVQPGDVLTFAPGTHRLAIQCRANDVTYRGKPGAILDGSEPVVNWIKMAQPAGWWCGDLPSGAQPTTANLYCHGEPMMIAQTPNVGAGQMDDLSKFLEFDPRQCDGVSLTHAMFGGASWTGATIALWVYGNTIQYRTITESSGGRVAWVDKVTPYNDRNGRFALLNSLHGMDTPGEYIIIGSKVYIIPPTGIDPRTAEITASIRNHAFDLRGADNITIEGFTIQKYCGGDWAGGVAIFNNSSGERCENLTVRDNVLRFNRNWSGTSATIDLRYCDDARIEGNTIADNPHQRGLLLVQCTGTVAAYNTIERNGGTGAYIAGGSGNTVKNCILRDCAAVHANGLTVGNGATDTVFDGNTVENYNIALTLNESYRTTITNNKLARTDDGFCAAAWDDFYPACWDTLTISGNTLSVTSPPRIAEMNAAQPTPTPDPTPAVKRYLITVPADSGITIEEIQ